MYDPEGTVVSHAYYLSPKLLSPDRPVSFGESSNSDSFSPPGSTTALYGKISGRGRGVEGGDITRKASIRSTMSEKLDFQDEMRFLNSRLNALPSDQLASTPEVIYVHTYNV